MLLQMLLLTVVAFLLLTVQAGATVISVGPGDCSASAVNSAIASASDGDMVLLTCTGSVTWTAQVSIPNTKGVILSGGGTNTPKSSARFPLTVVSAQRPAILISAGANNALSRLTGFRFQSVGDDSEHEFIQVTGQGVGKVGIGAFRIDNNYFDELSVSTVIAVLSRGGPLYGLIDNNTMHNVWRADAPDDGPIGVLIWNNFETGGCWGKDGWQNPFNFGGANFVFIEDNLFENTSTSPNRYMRHYVSSELGARYVARYNDFNVTVASPAGNQTDALEAHGFCLCSTNGVGSRGGEIYHNTFSGTEIGRPIMPRGGTWLIYDNTFNTIGSYGSPPWFMEYRAGDADMYSQCSLTCPCTASWVPSVTDGSHYPLEQQVAGTYIWNNLFGGVNQTGSIDPSGVQSLYIQEGRDYFVSTSRPAVLSSYAPYTYPHPLRGNPRNPPSPPQNIRLQ